tara:strand:+ start:68 stop:211 length:144 start_codon:yes stop_codon:yes gene_type:complete
MKKYDLNETKLQVSDPVDSYFECITSCDISDGICISRCVEILRDEVN